MRYAIYYTPPADDPLTRQAAQWLGRDLGKYKVEGSARLEEHMEHLTGGNYKGKDAIVAAAKAGDE